MSHQPNPGSGGNTPSSDRIDPARAAAGLARWRRALADAIGQDPGAAIDEPRRLLALLKVFGATQRLADMCMKHPACASQALIAGPSAALAEAARDLTALAGGIGGPDALYGALAPIKNRADLAVGLALLTGEWSAAEAAAARGDLAERIIETALAWLIRGAVNRGELAVTGDGLAESVFALAGGDFAHEDIGPVGPLEFAVIYDNARFAAEGCRTAERAFVRIGAEMREALEGKTGDYPLYCIKTPLGSGVSGAGFVESRARVAVALADAQQNALKRWLATARVVAGDRRCGGEFLEASEEAIWGAGSILGDKARADLQQPSADPRAPFRAAANILRWSLGRARPIFRTAPARQVFETAARSGVISHDLAARLSAGADLAQTIVDRTQMMKGVVCLDVTRTDEQAALAALCGFNSFELLAAARDGARAEAQNAVQRLLEGSRGEFELFRASDRSPDDIDRLEDLGFGNGADLASLVDGWAELCECGGAQRFSAIAPGLITAFGETQRPDAAVRLFDAVLRADPDAMSDLTKDTPRRAAMIDALGCFPETVAPLMNSAEAVAVILEARAEETPRTGAEWLSRHAPPVKGGINDLAEWRRQSIARIALCAAAGDMSFDAAARCLEGVQNATLKSVFELSAGGKTSGLTLHVFDGHGRGLPGAPAPLGFIATSGAPAESEPIARDFIENLAALGEGAFALAPDIIHRPGGGAAGLVPDVAQMKSFIQSEAIAQEQILLARARVIAGPESAAAKATAALRTAVANPKRGDILFRDLDRVRAQRLRRDRTASPWDFENAEGGLLDVDLIIGALIYRHAAAQPAVQGADPDDALDLMARAGILSGEVAETLKGARAFWIRLATVRALARWSDPQREPVRRRFGALIARAAEVENFAQVRPMMRGYAEEVTRLYAQLVLGRPTLSIVANG